MVAPTLAPTISVPFAPLASAVGAARSGIPASAWIALAATGLVVAALGYYTAARARERSLRRSGRAREHAKGLSAEQIAFQEEMRWMLQARIVAKGVAADRRAESDVAVGPAESGGGESGAEGEAGGTPLPPAIV